MIYLHGVTLETWMCARGNCSLTPVKLRGITLAQASCNRLRTAATSDSEHELNAVPHGGAQVCSVLCIELAGYPAGFSSGK